MEEVLSTLEEIIRRDYRIDSEGGTYVLKEEKEENYPLTPIRQRGKMLLYNFDIEDSNRLIFGLFNPKLPKLTSICDYIIFYPFEGQLFVFICDLKSKKTTAKSQVETGYVLARHIIQMLRKQLKFKEIAVEYRALVFSTNRRSKSATTIKEEYATLKDSKLLKRTLRAGNIVHLDNLCYP